MVQAMIDSLILQRRMNLQSRQNPQDVLLDRVLQELTVLALICKEYCNDERHRGKGSDRYTACTAREIGVQQISSHCRG
jgi:hypothetical protein